MKKILITQSSLTIGGIQKVLINLLNQLDYSKYQVDLVLLEKKGDYLRFIPSEVNVISITEKYDLKISKIERIIIELFGREWYFKKLYKNLKNENTYDIAIAFDGYVAFTDYYAAFSNAKKKYIWVHSDFYYRKVYQKSFGLKLLSMRKKYKMFDKVIAVSESSMNNFTDLFPEYKKKSTYIWDLIDLPDLDKVAAEKPHVVFDKKEYNIIAIGRLRKVKGFDRLIKVQKRLLSNGHNTKVYIVGEGPDRKRLEKLINKYGINDKVILLGELNNVYPILKQADLFVLSSYYEGFGVVLLESICCNVPILVPRISGAYDVAKYIAPKGSAQIVDNSIDGLYKGVLQSMNSKKIKIKFEIEKYNDSIMKKIERLLNE